MNERVRPAHCALDHDGYDIAKRLYREVAEARRLSASDWDIFDGILFGDTIKKPQHVFFALIHLRAQDHEGICSASNGVLAKRFGCTPDRVRKLVNEMVDAGILEFIGFHDVHQTRMTRISDRVIQSALAYARGRSAHRQYQPHPADPGHEVLQ